MRVTKDIFLPRKPGLLVRPEFLKRMAREHPRIRFAYAEGEWLVLQMMPNRNANLIFSAGPRLNEARVRRKLNASKVGRLTPEKADALLDEIDAQEELELKRQEFAAREKGREGSDRLYSYFTRGSRVAMPRKR